MASSLSCGTGSGNGVPPVTSEAETGSVDNRVPSVSPEVDTDSTGDDPPPASPETDTGSACPGKYQTEPPRLGRNDGFRSAGQERQFFLTMPRELPEGPVPIVFLFNGTGESGWGIALRTGLNRTAWEEGFILIAPYSNGNGNIWPVWDSYTTPFRSSSNPDLVFFDELLLCMAAHYPIDATRIYATGHSAGGIFTHYLAQRRSDVLAAIAPASADFGGTTPRPFEALDQMAVMIVWGGKNDYYTGSATGSSGNTTSVTRYEYEGQSKRAIRFYQRHLETVIACEGNNEGHRWITGLNSFLWDFFRAHPKGYGISEYAEALPEGSPEICYVP